VVVAPSRGYKDSTI